MEYPKTLVFGGGSRLARRLARYSSVVDARSRLVGREEADVRSMVQVLEAIEAYKPEVVVNCAAVTNVDACTRAPEHALSVNALGAANIATACRMRGVPLVHISTDYVFSGTNGPRAVNAPTYPVNAYGISKLLGESAVLSIMPTTVIVLRVGWLYGVEYTNGQPMVAAVQGGLRVNDDDGRAYIWDNIKGTPTHVSHAATMVTIAVRVMGMDSRSIHRVVHVGPDEAPVSWYEFLVQDFDILPMKDGAYKGARVARAHSTWRPTLGGLIPSEGWTTPSYRDSLDYFIEEFNASLTTKTGTGT